MYDALACVTKFFSDVIIDNIEYNIEDLVDLRVECGHIITNHEEQTLLDNIDYFIINNQHKDQANIIKVVNFILSMTLYHGIQLGG